MKSNIIASSPTIPGLEKLAQNFYFSQNVKIDPETMEITNSKGAITGVIVIKKGKRYRLEMIPVLLFLIALTSCTYVRHTVSAYSGQYSDSAAGVRYERGNIQRYNW